MLPRYKQQRRKAQANTCPRGQLAYGPQKYIEKDKRVNEPRHGMAQQQVIEQIRKLQIRITKYPVVLDALSPQLNGHPHRIGHEEKPQAAGKELAERIAKDLGREIAGYEEKQGKAKGIQPHV